MAVAMEAAQQVDPLRGAIVHLDELLMPEIRSRTSFAALATPAERADPDAVDLERKQKQFAFGGGPHACLGSHPARLDTRVVLDEWHRRIPDHELGPAGSDQVEWPAGLIGIDSLPLVFPPGRGPA